MAKSYWLINSKRSEVKRFKRNFDNPDKLFEYMFIDSGEIIGVLGFNPPLMKTRKEVKLKDAREEWLRLIAIGWRRTQEVW